ncbi:fused MFS/spermidine synthase [Streptomyces cellulosae]|uniref:Fused MFS/spermidine synthase n=1 Tax=Streptomyces thermocarboxydus TaxID=59299 RepID=A0ABU3JEW6_9ACTN|nr:fused MFS/spermidine synthase [Streptomyces thermocarboxydus]MYW51660.1 spermidine synthase-like protein [Streptomyces sp. SID8376]WSB51150.1 fused MFS/spermidine synthase [Streptomyces cellulosae]WSB53066.1 fused MFS/spermidine synthase [Streptomyces cellulosae]WSB89874.1 fused MFS/spermidine synthase [Streptomyces cellulosae]
MNEPIPVSRAVDHGTAKLMPDVDRERAWLLTVDGAPQSYVDLDEPTHLEFEYARRLGHVLDVAGEPGAPLDAVHLGGGAMTLPRYLAVTRPGSRQDVVEADAGLAALVAEVLPLPAGGGVAVHTVDARAWLEAASDSSADVVVGDVFGGSQVPAHLTTVGYVDEVARVLRGGGVYLANLADAAPFAFLRSQVATVGTRFAEVVLVAEPAVLRGRRFGNVVVAASDRALDIPALTRAVAGDPFPARVVQGEALWRWVGEARPVSEVTAVPSPLPPSGAFAVG